MTTKQQNMDAISKKIIYGKKVTKAKIILYTLCTGMVLTALSIDLKTDTANMSKVTDNMSPKAEFVSSEAGDSLKIAGEYYNP